MNNTSYYRVKIDRTVTQTVEVLVKIDGANAPALNSLGYYTEWDDIVNRGSTEDGKVYVSEPAVLDEVVEASFVIGASPIHSDQYEDGK